MTSYRKLALQTASTPLAWGTTYAVTTQLLPAGQPMWAALLRSLSGGVLAVAVARQLPVGVWWWRSLVLGGLNIGFFFPLLFISAEHLPGGVAAALGSIQPLAVAGFAVLILLRPTLLLEGLPRHVGAPAVLGYLWLALPGGVIAYTVWFRGIRSLPATPASLLGLLSPLMAATLGVLVVHDSPTPWQVLGFALAVGSVAVAHLQPAATTDAA